MHFVVREYTTKLMDAMDSGTLDPRDVADMCLQWLSEHEVKAMCLDNDMFEDEEEEVLYDED